MGFNSFAGRLPPRPPPPPQPAPGRARRAEPSGWSVGRPARLSGKLV